MPIDIRDRPYLGNDDILGLNFIKSPGSYIYRRHYREGLRSHIMELLTRESVENETRGILINGLRSYPQPEPVKMLRIFKTRFRNLEGAIEEIARVKTIAGYLAPDNIARSQEFLVDYIRQGGIREILLCGLQEFIKGVVVDPWGLADEKHLHSLIHELSIKHGEYSGKTCEKFIHIVLRKGVGFVERLRKLVLEARHVPDLAGVGNLILTRSGDIKLVDINNISKVSFTSAIPLDDRGYPVCDKSIEALSLLEQGLLGMPCSSSDPIYTTFLDPARMKEVSIIEKGFYNSMRPTVTYTD